MTAVGEQLPEPAQISQSGREAAVVEKRPGRVDRTVRVLFRTEA